MNKYWTRLCMISLIFVIGFASIPSLGHADNEIKVTYNDNKIQFSKEPVTKNNSTYVETRPFIQPLGLRVDWINSTQFKLSKPNLVITMEVNSSTATVNGSKLSLASAPIKIGATLFLPVRPLAALLDLEITWLAATNTIALRTKSTSNKPYTPPTLPGDPYKIIAYYPSWSAYQNFEVSQAAASSVTHINYAFANLRDGKVVIGDSAVDNSNIKKLNQLKKVNPKLKTLISVGGWTWSDQFSDVAQSIYSRTRFADSVVQFLRNNDFDGIDLDWEYPVTGGLATNASRPEDKQNFTLLLRTIRDKLDAAQLKDGKVYLLTIAAASFSSYMSNIEIAKVAGIVDWINLMTYDYHGDWEKRSNLIAPLYADPNDPANAESNIDYTIKMYLNAKVPSKKLVLGIPFYGRSWTNCSSTNSGLFQACSGVAEGAIADGIHEYGNLVKQGWITGNGFVRYWNDSSRVPWLYNKTTKTFISYEDPESIAYKAGYIKTKELGGAMVWELSQDSNNTLLNKLVYSLK